MKLAVLELRLTAVDEQDGRTRWNGQPMASKAASNALRCAVDAFSAAVKEAGLEVVHTRCGVTAREIEPST